MAEVRSDTRDRKGCVTTAERIVVAGSIGARK